MEHGAPLRPVAVLGHLEIFQSRKVHDQGVVAADGARRGGVLILETPSPLSVVMSARNFWVDPTHKRPVHPASLEVTFREAGFEPVHRIDLHPFPDEERLPEIDI